MILTGIRNSIKPKRQEIIPEEPKLLELKPTVADMEVDMKNYPIDDIDAKA